MGEEPMDGVTETVEVHFEDLDAQGVVHNARYVLLLERALSAYWTKNGYPWDPSSPQFMDVFFVVKEFTITYHAPIARPGQRPDLDRPPGQHQRGVRLPGGVAGRGHNLRRGPPRSGAARPGDAAPPRDRPPSAPRVRAAAQPGRAGPRGPASPTPASPVRPEGWPRWMER